MKKSIMFVLLLMVLSCAEPALAQRSKDNFDSPTNPPVKRIPVEIPITNQIYVQARLNDSQPMWFILDTGATWTILDVDKARELNIKSEGARTLDLGQTHTVSTTFAKDASLDISGMRVPVKTLAVMPAKFRHAPQIVGLIGSDLFKRFVVEIDYDAKAINVFEPDKYKYTGHGEILPIELIEEIPHIIANISRGDLSSLRTKLLVDTGAAETLVLYAPIVEKNKLLESTKGTVKLRTGGLGGGDFNYKVRAKTVTIGNTTLNKPLINFSTGKGAADRRDGVIGNGLLDRFKLIIDYSRQRVILEPSQRFNDPTDFDFFVFKLGRDANNYIVTDMLGASMTGEAGLRTGDFLMAVDGKPVSGLQLIEIQKMFMMDGRDRILSIRRGDQKLDIKLETFPIY